MRGEGKTVREISYIQQNYQMRWVTLRLYQQDLCVYHLLTDHAVYPYPDTKSAGVEVEDQQLKITTHGWDKNKRCLTIKHLEVIFYIICQVYMQVE